MSATTTSLPRALEARPEPRADHTIDQDWEHYRAEEHALWDQLFTAQMALLPGRAAPEFLTHAQSLFRAGGIPDLRRLNERLGRATGWQVVAVPGLVPERVFFEHLAARRFPASNFLRGPEQLDYLAEPDVFHDVFGHVPMLMDPVFADYMQAYGRGGLRADGLGVLAHLARLYWYTVEFGLIDTPAGLRIYGAGILSSRTESVFALENASPHQASFDLEQVMRTRYRIDAFQECYFVIDSYRTLLDLARLDFAPLYERLRSGPTHEPGAPGATLRRRGTGAYHAAGQADTSL